MTLDALVLDAGLRQSLVAVRSLGRRGISVGALDSGTRAPAFTSRWCRQEFVCPAGSSDCYLDCVEQALANTGARVLIPSGDGTIAQIRKRRSLLEGRVRIALAKEEPLSIAVNKERTLEIAQRLGIGVPRGRVVAHECEVPAAVRDIGLPAVVKPSESWLWIEPRGTRVISRLVATLEEARQAVADLTRSGGITLFQELLTGRREAVSLLYSNGVIHARFAQWAKRTSPPLGGESVLRQSIAVPPDIGAQAERLIRDIELEGYSEVEFRRDADGIPRLMEINPRLSASVEIAVRSGIDFPYLLYQWAAGEPIDTAGGYRVGGWMRYLKGDLTSTIASVRQRGRPGLLPPGRALLDFGLSFFKPMAYDYLDWSDPRPALRAAADFTRHALKSVAKAKLPALRRRLS